MNQIITYRGVTCAVEHRIEDGKIVASVSQVDENNVFNDDVQIAHDGYGYIDEDGKVVSLHMLVENCVVRYLEAMQAQWMKDREADYTADGGIDNAL